MSGNKNGGFVISNEFADSGLSCFAQAVSSESGQCSDSEQRVKSLATTGFIGCSSKNGQCSEKGQSSEYGQCPDFEQRRKTVDTTEFRRDLIGILREVKSRDLKN